MRVAIAGGTGLIGARLSRALLERGDDVIIVGRSRERILEVFGDTVRAETYETLTAEACSGIDAVVNLAGENVGARLGWTSESMHEILESRLRVTTDLAKLISTSREGPRLLNASGIAVYANQDDGDETVVDEDSAVPQNPHDFLTDVSVKWEGCATALLPAKRIVLLRIGVVLSPGAGALAKMELPFRLGVGGRQGSGRQNLSWISIEDCVRAIVFLLDRPDVHGPVNLVAGFSAQIDFAEALATALHRPCFVATPSFALRWVLGEEMAKALVFSSHRIAPKRLRDAGFVFQDAELGPTLWRLYNPSG